MPTNNFKPFSIASNANVISQANYEALAALAGGFTAGKASSAQINKALRQGTVMASVLAQFIANSSGNDVLDDGDTATILTNLIAALKANSSNDFLQILNNLAEIKNAGAEDQASARTNLGLGNSSTLNVGTVAGTIAAADDARIVGALQKDSNLADLPSPSDSRDNLGLGSVATKDVGTGSGMIPDMSSFASGVGSSAWWYKHPSGVIEQYGLVSDMSSTGITIAYPIAFPNEFRTLQLGVTGDSGADNYTVAILSLNPATGTKKTHFTVTGYNTSISSAGTPNNSTLSDVIFYWRATGA